MIIIELRVKLKDEAAQSLEYQEIEMLGENLKDIIYDADIRSIRDITYEIKVNND